MRAVSGCFAPSSLLVHRGKLPPHAATHSPSTSPPRSTPAPRPSRLRPEKPRPPPLHHQPIPALRLAPPPRPRAPRPDRPRLHRHPLRRRRDGFERPALLPPRSGSPAAPGDSGRRRRKGLARLADAVPRSAAPYPHPQSLRQGVHPRFDQRFAPAHSAHRRQAARPRRHRRPNGSHRRFRRPVPAVRHRRAAWFSAGGLPSDQGMVRSPHRRAIHQRLGRNPHPLEHRRHRDQQLLRPDRRVEDENAGRRLAHPPAQR